MMNSTELRLFTSSSSFVIPKVIPPFKREAVKKFKREREKPLPLSGGGANSCRQNRREMQGYKALAWLPPGDASNLEIT
jgi:hypothetical protein